MHSISNEAFDKNRLNLGKEYLRYNDLSSQQVIEVMNALSFESSRLEFAKLAYGRVYDPQNYFLVMNALTFSSSKNELQRYISGL
jgi:AAA+ ATPase superfamily predicted ATPase